MQKKSTSNDFNRMPPSGKRGNAFKRRFTVLALLGENGPIANAGRHVFCALGNRCQVTSRILCSLGQIKRPGAQKPGDDVANPHAGFLNINLVSPLRGAISHQPSVISKKLTADG
jgi:hypothetical protein